MNVHQKTAFAAGVEPTSIVALERFIISTRDSGYKSTASAVSELVDNSLQAKARHIRIFIIHPTAGSADDIMFAVGDDGTGMDGATLVQSLRFGGSSRYNDRSGLGRFGMGLPNASLGQAARVTVYTKEKGGSVLSSHLDVDEIARGAMDSIPIGKPTQFPEWVVAKGYQPASGTLVVWERCDRLDNRRISTIEKKLHQSLGRAFRHFLWRGVKIGINGKPVKPVDPLFLHGDSPFSGAKEFQKLITLEIYAKPDDPAKIGQVEIRFSELPIYQWHELSNDDKRAYGIANGAGISIVRAGREVDFGWFFMPGKRRENYDDWWRCEVQFWPELDEAFGITHTKQQIRPKEHLLEALQPVIETTAKALNARVRDAHLSLKSVKASSPAEEVASGRDAVLKPIPEQRAKASDQKTFDDLARRHESIGKKKSGTTSYKIVEDELPGASFYKPIYAHGNVVTVVNPKHSFYKRLYSLLKDTEDSGSKNSMHALQLVLLAAARAEVSAKSAQERRAIEKFRLSWSQILDVLLRS